MRSTRARLAGQLILATAVALAAATGGLLAGWSVVAAIAVYALAGLATFGALAGYTLVTAERAARPTAPPEAPMPGARTREAG